MHVNLSLLTLYFMLTCMCMYTNIFFLMQHSIDKVNILIALIIFMFTGILNSYIIIQLGIFWLCHVSVIFVKTQFPFYSRGLEKSKKNPYHSSTIGSAAALYTCNCSTFDWRIFDCIIPTKCVPYKESRYRILFICIYFECECCYWCAISGYHFHDHYQGNMYFIVW